MNESVNWEKIRQEFKNRFKAMRDKELVETLDLERKKQGWCFARMNYLWLLHEELDSRGLNQ